VKRKTTWTIYYFHVT